MHRWKSRLGRQSVERLSQAPSSPKGSARPPGLIARSVPEGLGEGDEATLRPAGTGSSGA